MANPLSNIDLNQIIQQQSSGPAATNQKSQGIDANRLLASLLVRTVKAAAKTPTPAGVGGALVQRPDIQQGLSSLGQLNPLGVADAIASETTMEIANKEAKKAISARVKGIIDQGVRPEDILATTSGQGGLGFGVRQSGQQGPGPRQAAQPVSQSQPQTVAREQQPQQAQDPNKLLQTLGNLVGGFFEGGAEALGVTTERASQREASKEQNKFLQNLALENFKQDRQDQREELKSRLEDGGASGIESQSAVMAMDIQDLVDARSQVAGKGPVSGPIGALFSNVTGSGKAQREAFNTIAEGLVFSIGKTLLEQSGRGFTETEQENVRKKILGASLSRRDGEFFSKLDSVIRLVNNRITAASKRQGKTPQLIPNSRELLQQSKGAGKNIGQQSGGLKVVSITEK